MKNVKYISLQFQTLKNSFGKVSFVYKSMKALLAINYLELINMSVYFVMEGQYTCGESTKICPL